VGFVGPCDVANADLVDLEDRAAGTFIRARSMVHVVAEHPGCSIQVAVLRQRLLITLLCDALRERKVETTRRGDDVFVDGRKLTVSIAAPSAGSSLIHLGINVDSEGAPVPAIGLAEMGCDPPDLLRALLNSYTEELASCAHAETKVRTV
jgi:hypothetical protein